MTAIDEMFAHASAHQVSLPAAHLPRSPAKHVVVVTCMDARIDLDAVFGTSLGDANVLRNAGGVVTADVRRSVAISQRLLGTIEVLVLGHTGCGLLDVDDAEFAAAIHADTGKRPDWSAQAFTDLDARVRQSVAEIVADPFLPATSPVRGFVYDLDTGDVREVS